VKLRFSVDQAEAFRLGIDVPKSIVTIDVTPSDVDAKTRHLIADRLEGIDVVQLQLDAGKFVKDDVEGEKHNRKIGKRSKIYHYPNSSDPDVQVERSLVSALRPELDSLIAAVRCEERELHRKESSWYKANAAAVMALGDNLQLANLMHLHRDLFESLRPDHSARLTDAILERLELYNSGRINQKQLLSKDPLAVVQYRDIPSPTRFDDCTARKIMKRAREEGRALTDAEIAEIRKIDAGMIETFEEGRQRKKH
jgi:hypothetical protein